jgi:hypothetical protein
MQDEPSIDAILDIVARFLREEAAPALNGRPGFHARVAANAVDLARRASRLGPQADEEERARLRELLGGDGETAALNRELTNRLFDGRLTLDAAGVRAHLWRTTMEKLAVDQPTYATYGRALQRGRI